MARTPQISHVPRCGRVGRGGCRGRTGWCPRCRRPASTPSTGATPVIAAARVAWACRRSGRPRRRPRFRGSNSRQEKTSMKQRPETSSAWMVIELVSMNCIADQPSRSPSPNRSAGAGRVRACRSRRSRSARTGGWCPDPRGGGARSRVGRSPRASPMARSATSGSAPSPHPPVPRAGPCARAAVPSLIAPTVRDRVPANAAGAGLRFQAPISSGHRMGRSGKRCASCAISRPALRRRVARW